MTQGRKRGSLVDCRCKLCGTVERSPGAGQWFRCTSCKTAGATHREMTPQGLVARAVREGVLAHPASFPCVDCGGAATEYEHRDYNKPLEVEPTCRSCNLRRGPAIPKRGAFDEIVARGGAPYCLRTNAEKLLVTMGLPTDVLASMPAKLTNEHWRVLLPLFSSPAFSGCILPQPNDGTGRLNAGPCASYKVSTYMGTA